MIIFEKSILTMNILDKLVEAINTRTPVSFEYNKPGKVRGIRIGNPHAVFIFTAKSGSKSTKVHLVQTSGVSDSKDRNPFPDFRMFNIEDLSNVELLTDEHQFTIDADKYNPEWDGYSNVLAKV